MCKLTQIQKEFHIDMMILHNKYIDKINKIENLEYDANDENIGVTEEKTSEDDFSKQLIPDQIQTELESIENSDEQDQVWNRMQNARLELFQLNSNESASKNIISELISDKTSEKIVKENNLTVETNLNEVLIKDKLSGELNETDIDETRSLEVSSDILKPSFINALHRINPTQRKAILIDIYKSSVENMNELSKFDDYIKNNLEEEINKESNRLLQLYLDTH
jgi:hypothetical protein